MLFVDLLIGVGAANAIVELLRHDVRLQDLRDWADTAESFWAKVLSCGFCSSFHAGLIVAFIMLLPKLLGFPLWWITYCVALALALARYAQILNDVLHSYSRSPGRPDE